MADWKACIACSYWPARAAWRPWSKDARAEPVSVTRELAVAVPAAGAGVAAEAGSGVGVTGEAGDGAGGAVCAVDSGGRPPSGLALLSPPELVAGAGGVVGSFDEHALADRLRRIARTAVMDGVGRIVPLIIR
jgi:hypothetical protein